MAMLDRILAAALAAGVAFLVCIFVGGLLVVTKIEILVYIGAFMVQWATAIAILAAIGGFVSPGRLAFWRRTA